MGDFDNLKQKLGLKEWWVSDEITSAAESSLIPPYPGWQEHKCANSEGKDCPICGRKHGG